MSDGGLMTEEVRVFVWETSLFGRASWRKIEYILISRGQPCADSSHVPRYCIVALYVVCVYVCMCVCMNEYMFI